MEIQKRKREKHEEEEKTAMKRLKKKRTSEKKIECSSSNSKLEKKGKNDITEEKQREPAEILFSNATLESNLIHNRADDFIDEWKKAKGQYCSDFDESGICILFKHSEKNPSLASTILQIANNSCSKKGVCRYTKNCIMACKRFSSYQIAISILKYKKHQPLPICVRLYILDLYGKNENDYKP